MNAVKKRPHHMTMSELIALPVIATRDRLVPLAGCSRGVFGGSFTDTGGALWRTLRTKDGWARYPAQLGVVADTGQHALDVPVAARKAPLSRLLSNEV